MHTIICFILLLTITVATDVDVYVYNGYEFYPGTNQTVAKLLPIALFIFGYHRGDTLSMQIYLRNEAVNVTTDVYLYHPSGDNMKKEKLSIYYYNGEKYFLIKRVLNYSEIFIELELSVTTGICIKKQIVKGKDVTGLPDKTNDTPYNKICLKDQYCVIEVDLLNVFEESTDQPVSSQNAVLIYVIPSVIVMCVIISVIYTTVKNYSHRNTHPVETIELNTYSTPNEVVYADLNLVPGDCQPPKRDEESPYAEIIGVLHHSTTKN